MSTREPVTFGALLRHLRLAVGLTQATLAARAGLSERAALLFAEALTICHRHRYAHGVASELAGIASLRVWAGEYERATPLFGAAEALLERARSVFAPADQTVFERDVVTTRAQLGDSSIEASWAAGRALSTDEVAETLGGSSRSASYLTHQ